MPGKLVHLLLTPLSAGAGGAASRVEVKGTVALEREALWPFTVLGTRRFFLLPWSQNRSQHTANGSRSKTQCRETKALHTYSYNLTVDDGILPPG